MLLLFAFGIVLTCGLVIGWLAGDLIGAVLDRRESRRRNDAAKATAMMHLRKQEQFLDWLENQR